MSNDLMQKSEELNADFLAWLKRLILFNYGTVAAFAAAKGIYNTTEWSLVLNGSKKIQLSKVFAALEALEVKVTFDAKGLQPWSLGSSFGAEVNQSQKMHEAPKDQSKADKEALKAEQAKVKEARRRWHKFRHLILPDPEINLEVIEKFGDVEEGVLEIVHSHIVEMFPIIANILDNLAVIGFVMVKDKDQNRFFLCQNQGWPNLVIPMDLDECGLPCEHPFQNLFSSRHENLCRTANGREIIWWYFAVFLPCKRKLEAMLEAGCSPDAQNMKHYFGADSIEFFGLVRNSRTGKSAPMHKLRHLEWDIENDVDISYHPYTELGEGEEE